MSKSNPTPPPVASQDNRDIAETASSIVEAGDDKIQLFAEHDPDIFRHIAKAYLDTFGFQSPVASPAFEAMLIALKRAKSCGLIQWCETSGWAHIDFAEHATRALTLAEAELKGIK